MKDGVNEMEKNQDVEKELQEVEETEVPIEKKGHSKMILLLVVVLVVGVIGGTAGTFIGNLFSNKKAKTEEVDHISGKISNDQDSIALDEFLVNLAPSKTGEDEYIKISISLLVPAKVGEKEVEKNKDVIRDSIVNTLRKTQAESILNDSKGVESLKVELKEAINKANNSSLVKEVFITNLVIQ